MIKISSNQSSFVADEKGIVELKKDFLRFQEDVLKWLNDLTEKEGRKRSIAEEDKGQGELTGNEW